MVGAGEAGRTLARALRRSPNYGLVPIGFLDDARGLDARRRAAGARPHLGASRGGAGQAGGRLRGRDPVTARAGGSPRSSRPRRTCGLHVRFLPSFLAAVERDARVSDLRQIRVEDLLGRRELHVVSEKAAALISGRRVLVTGAGGSIGSELCRQIQGFGPEPLLYLLDHDESNLHGLQLEITGSGLLDATRSSSPTSATSAGSTRSSRRSGPTWSSMRRRTSTCRCSSAIRARP